MTDDILFEGTIAPMNISLNRFGSYSMAQYDFTIYAFCTSSKVVEIPKSEAVAVDDDNYMFWVDTAKTGTGNLRFAVKALIPDPSLPEFVRPEIVEFDSGYKVVKSVATKR